jgi:hypothetical protein
MDSEKEILKLKPEFKFGNQKVRDWFYINGGDSFYSIRNGLRHADGETKSPYFYEHTTIGENCKKDALKLFTEWWNNINEIKI